MYLTVGDQHFQTSGNTLMTFLHLSVFAFAPIVQYERLVGVPVESSTANEKDAPVPSTNGGDLSVDEWEWGTAKRRRPEP
jgi:hypothetical protein